MEEPGDRVVLIHGLGRSPVSFFRLAHRLRAAGFRVHAPRYPSTRAGLDQLVHEVMPHVAPPGAVSFVGHSLGGLIALKLWLDLPPDRRGRLVQLGTPNLGSQAAREFGFLARFLGPVLRDLEPRAGLQVPPASDRIAAIAGTAAPDALSKVTGLEGPNDGLVTVDSALAAAPEHRLTVPVLHTFLMLDARAIDPTVRFLETGRF